VDRSTVVVVYTVGFVIVPSLLYRMVSLSIVAASYFGSVWEVSPE
jgi:hypothetical protein